MDIRDFLSRLHVEAGPNGSGEYMCRCPAHDDKTASLCVRDGEKGIVLKCQAGCDTEAVVMAMGLKMRDLFREASASVGKTPQPASNQPAKKGGGKKPRGKFVCAYSYTDESGKVLFEACRYQREDGSKTFSLRQPDPSRPDGYKYTKEGARLVLYKLPQVLAAIKAGKPVFVVEGEKDCDNMELMGYTATTNPMGAGKWLAGDYSNSLTGADLYIIPDNDDVGRNHAKQVAQSTYKLAKSVRMVELAKVCSELPPKGDVTDMYKLLGRKAGDAALKQAMQAAEPFTGDALAQRDAAAEYYNRVYGYCVDNGRICQETQDGPKPLANFVVLPRAVVTRDDGVNISQETILDGWTMDGAPLPRVNVKTDQFDSMGWVTKNWDFRANIAPGNTVKDRLRYAISEVGRETCERITQYTHTGWRKIGGKWAYLYEGGAVGAEGVTVSLGSGLDMYRLDGNGDERFKSISYLDGAMMTLDISNVIAEHVCIPLLGTIFLAPLREFLSETGIAPAYALFLLGGTGSRKSTAAALALSHFGNFTGKSLPASFNDTANFIRKKAFLLKDAPIVVDDYHPVTSLQERKKMEATAQSLARAFGDGAERGRMKSDLTLQESMPPRGVAIISGEDTPGVGESGMARFYVVNVSRDDVPATEALTSMQEVARMGYLQKSMRGYILWLLKQIDEMPTLLHEDFLRNRAIAIEKTKGQHGRTAEAIAHMMLGYDSMLRYLRDVGAITTDDCIRMSAHAWQVVTDNSRKQSEDMREDRPSKIFLSSIGELLISKGAAVRDLTFSPGESGGSTPKDMIGYMDADFYYLMPQVAYRAVARLCNDQGQAFPLTLKMLYKQMREDGVLTPETTTTSSATRPKCIDGKSQRLLWIPRRLIDGPKVAQEQMRMDYAAKSDFVPVDDADLPDEFR